MDLEVLTGIRRGHLLNLTRAQLPDDGIRVHISKTGGNLVIDRSDDLREVVASAMRMKLQVRQYVLESKGRKPFSANGFQSTSQRALYQGIEEGGQRQHFTFNDLWLMSTSDTESVIDASDRLGRTTTDVTRRASGRRSAIVKPLKRPSK